LPDHSPPNSQKREKNPIYGILFDNKVIYGTVYAITKFNLEPIGTTIVMNSFEKWRRRLSGFSLFKHNRPVIYSSSPAIHRDCLEPAATANKASVKASTTMR
jgi:hypothetical protein